MNRSEKIRMNKKIKREKKENENIFSFKYVLMHFTGNVFAWGDSLQDVFNQCKDENNIEIEGYSYNTRITLSILRKAKIEEINNIFLVHGEKELINLYAEHIKNGFGITKNDIDEIINQ